MDIDDLARRIGLIEQWRGESAPQIAVQGILASRAVNDLADVRDKIDVLSEKVQNNLRWTIGLLITSVLANGAIAIIVLRYGH